jgi:hypothetical protein
MDLSRLPVPVQVRVTRLERAEAEGQKPLSSNLTVDIDKVRLGLVFAVPPGMPSSFPSGTSCVCACVCVCVCVCVWCTCCYVRTIRQARCC